MIDVIITLQSYPLSWAVLDAFLVRRSSRHSRRWETCRGLCGQAAGIHRYAIVRLYSHNSTYVPKRASPLLVRFQLTVRLGRFALQVVQSWPWMAAVRPYNSWVADAHVSRYQSMSQLS
jgi:hypothetical protein